MTLEQGLAFGLMGATVAAFIWGKLRFDLAALAALIVGALIGVIPADEMFSGFGNELIWIIASALLLSAAIARSGVVAKVVDPILGWLPNAALQVPAFAGATMILSMLTKNIGALAIVMPVAVKHGLKTGTAPSRVLMPMAFASLLGGLVTLVGTTPNVVVSSMRESMLGEPFNFFDFAPVGLGICAVGFVFLAVAPFFIRIDRAPPVSLESALAGAAYVTEFSIGAESPFLGKPYRSLFAAVGEGCRIVSAVPKDDGAKATPAHKVRVNDRLIVEGDEAELQKFAAKAGLVLVGERHREEEKPATTSRVIEGVVSADSPLVRTSASRYRLHERYGLSLIAVRREGSRITTELRALRLRPGDVVMLKADQEHIGEALADLRILPLSERTLALGARRFGYAPVVLLGAAIGAIALGWAPIHLAFAAAAVGVLLLQVMSMQEAYRAIDGSLLVLLAALIPISESISRTGGDVLIAGLLSQFMAPMPPTLAVGALIVFGMAVTPFLNNAATVLILAPIAAAIATNLNVNPDPFLMAVAIGAACDFLTPIGHQSNTLVMGPGGYRFSDYWKLGLPLSILVVLTATPLIMMVWA